MGWTKIRGSFPVMPSKSDVLNANAGIKELYMLIDININIKIGSRSRLALPSSGQLTYLYKALAS